MSVSDRCECRFGFCVAEAILAAFGDAVMDGDTERADTIEAEYRKQIARCEGGFRAAPPRNTQQGGAST